MPPHPSRSFLWALLESGGLSVLSLTVLFVIARILGPTDLGTAAIALGVIQMLAIVPETLMHDALVQRPDLDDIHLDTAFWTCLAIGVVFAASSGFGSAVVAAAFDDEALAPLLAVASISLIFSGASSVAVAVLRRRFLFKALALRSLYGRLFGALAAIALALFGFGIWSLIAQHLLQTAINAVFVWQACPWRPRLRFDSLRLRQLLSFGIVSMGTRMMWLSGSKLFTVLVGYFVGATAVGYLNVAQRVVYTLRDMLCGAVFNIALPTFSRSQDDPTAIARGYSAGTELAGISVSPIFGGLAICAGPIIALFAGDGWEPAVPVVQAFAIFAMVDVPFLLAEPVIIALGRPGYMFILSSIWLTLVVGAFFVFAPSSAFVAAVLWGCPLLITFPVVLVMLHRLIGRSLTDLLRDSWAPSLATALMAGSLWQLQSLALMDLPPLQTLIVEIPLGALIYVALIAAIKRDSLNRVVLFVTAGIRGGTVSPEKG